MLTQTGGISQYETTCHLCGQFIQTFYFIKVGMSAELTRDYRVCDSCRDFVVTTLDHLHNITAEIPALKEVDE